MQKTGNRDVRSDRIDVTVERFWACSLLLLIAASYPLWTPLTPVEYPEIAMHGLLEKWQSPVDVIAVPMLVLGLLAACWPGRRRRWWLATAVFVSLAMATDQHRLQPWAYQFTIYACVFGLASETRKLTLLRALTISIYVFSAAGKLFDQQFAQTVGQEFLSTVAGLIGLPIEEWTIEAKANATFCFPASELLVAALLACPKSLWPNGRRLGGVAAICMHLALITLLSPLGMNHSNGVLAWNMVLAGQAYLLFVRREPARATEENVTATSKYGDAIASIIVAVLILMPTLERRGIWDHWMSWALYSPHNSRVDVQIHRSLRERLPDSIQAAASVDGDQDGWYGWDLGQWSLATRGVPVVPQARYQIALVCSVIKEQEITNGIRGIQQSVANRRTGERQQRFLNGPSDFLDAQSSYWLVAMKNRDGPTD